MNTSTSRKSLRIAGLVLAGALLFTSCAGKKSSTGTTVKGATTVTLKGKDGKKDDKTTTTDKKDDKPTTTDKDGKGATTTKAGKKPKPTVPASLKEAATTPVTTLKKGDGPLATHKPVSTLRPAVTKAVPTVPAGKAPEKPEDSDCSSFDDWSEAKQFYDTYYSYYGDFSRLDGDGDGIPCESLPGSPK
jgi:hypothetical protein